MAQEPKQGQENGVPPTGPGEAAMVASETREKPAARTDDELVEGAMVDHFEVVSPLGHGGMGAVYLAIDVRLQRRVALKVVRPEMLGSDKARESFLYEARTTARFNHPNIVTVYAVGEHEGKPYLALEYVEGRSLREELRARRLPLIEALRVATAVADALHEANEHGVQHRDLKPANILLTKDGTPKVLDFGLAKRTDEHTPPSSRGLFPGRRDYTWAGAGTPAYMAPEQWRMTPSTSATDVWALGAIMYEMFTGRRPLVGETAAEQAQLVCSLEPVPSVAEHGAVPDELAALVDACLAKRQEERPAAREVATRLRQVANTLSRSEGLATADTLPVEGRSGVSAASAGTASPPTRGDGQSGPRPLVSASAVAVFGGLVAAGLAGYALSQTTTTVGPEPATSAAPSLSASAAPPLLSVTATTPHPERLDSAPTAVAPAPAPTTSTSATPRAPIPVAPGPVSEAAWPALAQSRIDGAASRCARSCVWVDGWTRFALTVTVASDGSVTDLGRTVVNDTVVCCSQMLSATRVPAFEGAPRTLHTTVVRPP